MRSSVRGVSVFRPRWVPRIGGALRVASCGAALAVGLAGNAAAQTAFSAGPASGASAAASNPAGPGNGFSVGPGDVAAMPERPVAEWLARVNDAARQRNYIGTFIVSSNAGGLSSARIWHAVDADTQMQRVEVLTGAPRSTVRRNDEVVTFYPEVRVARVERRESAGMFPGLVRASTHSIPEFYQARRAGHDRVAGFDADVVLLVPKDALRFGYRVWNERRSGLVIKLQTLGMDGSVLEQAAFSELQLDVPLKVEKMARLMAVPDGWRVEKSDAFKTGVQAEGWTLRSAVPGFASVAGYKRTVAAGEGVTQWIFTDGLASVSLFIEPFDAKRHLQEGSMADGATNTVTRRSQDWWITAVGEVPPATLRLFTQSVERRR